MSWPNGGLTTFSWYIICGVLPTAALLFLQLRHKAIYLRHRIPIVLTVRGIRILGVLVALGPAQNEIWPPSHPTSCTPTLLASQANKVFYLVAQTVGFQVPLVYQVWVAVAGAVVALFFVPQRCMSFIAVSPAVGHCSLKSMAKLSWLNKLWVMSLSNPESYGANLMPWQVCAQLQALLIVSDFKVIYAPQPASLANWHNILCYLYIFNRRATWLSSYANSAGLVTCLRFKLLTCPWFSNFLRFLSCRLLWGQLPPSLSTHLSRLHGAWSGPARKEAPLSYLLYGTALHSTSY